jgi:predicted GNAT family acetyltransferase
VHAQSAYEESGIDPLEVDPEGFYRRCARRVEQGRTWVLVDNNKLIFKAEVVADTPHVAYLEGVWVNPEERGRGWGLRCLSQLTRTLLLHSKSVCLLVNEQNRQAVAFYKRAGYKLISNYDTIFLSRRD